jgi:hypothetical protein
LLSETDLSTLPPFQFTLRIYSIFNSHFKSIRFSIHASNLFHFLSRFILWFSPRVCPLHLFLVFHQRFLYFINITCFLNEIMDISARQLQKARRSAAKAKAYLSCVACTAYKKRCSESRPCLSCVKASRQCLRAGPQFAHTESTKQSYSLSNIFVERPFLCTNVIDRIDHDRILPDFKFKVEWAYAAVLQLVCMGHQAHIFEKYTTHMTPHLIYDIGAALGDAKAMAMAIKSQLSHPVAAAAQPLQSAQSPTSAAALFSTDDSEHAWAMSEQVGVLSMVAPPGSQQRRTIFANPRQASLAGMHLEEFLARSAARDLPAPLTELDALLVLLFRIVRDAFGVGQYESFLRVRRGRRGLGAGCLLVCLRTVVVLGEGGEVREVISPPTCPELSTPSGRARACLNWGEARGYPPPSPRFARPMVAPPRSPSGVRGANAASTRRPDRPRPFSLAEAPSSRSRSPPRLSAPYVAQPPPMTKT